MLVGHTDNTLTIISWAFFVKNMALKPDLKLIKGDTYSIRFELTNDNEPVDLTGSTVYFTAKAAFDDDTADNAAIIAVEVTDHTDPTNGLTDIPLSASDTTADAGEYYYDIQVKKADASIASIKYRKLEIYEDVTRRSS
jgi:hypothetical protein